MLVTRFLRDCARIAWATATLPDLLRATAPRIAQSYVERHFTDPVTGALRLEELGTREFERAEAAFWWAILGLVARGDGTAATVATATLNLATGDPIRVKLDHWFDYEDPRLRALLQLVSSPPGVAPDHVMQLAVDAFPTRPAALLKQAVFEGRWEFQTSGRGRARNRSDDEAIAFREMAAVLALATAFYKKSTGVDRFERSFRTWASSGALRGNKVSALWKSVKTLPPRLVRLLIEADWYGPRDLGVHDDVHRIDLPSSADRLRSLASHLPESAERDLAERGVFTTKSVAQLENLDLARGPEETEVSPAERSLKRETIYVIEKLDFDHTDVVERLFHLASPIDQSAAAYLHSTKSPLHAIFRPTPEHHARAVVHSIDKTGVPQPSEDGRLGVLEAVTLRAGRIGSRERHDEAEVLRLVVALIKAIRGATSSMQLIDATGRSIAAVRSVIVHHLNSRRPGVGRVNSRARFKRTRDRLIEAWWTLVCEVLSVPGPAGPGTLELESPVDGNVHVLLQLARTRPEAAVRSLAYFGRAGASTALKLLRSDLDTHLKRAIDGFPRVVALLLVRDLAARPTVVETLSEDATLRTRFLEKLPRALADRPKVAAAIELALRSDMSIFPNLLQLAEDFNLRARHTYGSQFAGHYQTYHRPKQSGGRRLVAVPSAGLKFTQRTLLRAMFDGAKVHPSAHGFVREHNVATNARPHVGRRVVVNVDIRDFFGSTRYQHIIGACRAAIGPDASPRAVTFLAELCSFNGALPTGAPTSPAIANLVLRKLDAALDTAARRRGVNYTRYADDITFSSDTDDAVELIPFVEHLLGELALELDERKTHVYRKGRRQEVTGLVVNEKASVNRTYRRRLRAAVHNYVTTGQAQWRGRPMSLASLMGHLGNLAQTQATEAALLREKLATKNHLAAS